jgi:protein-S-isoprenylcysteine O-methyltransferase Ste14
MSRFGPSIVKVLALETGIALVVFLSAGRVNLPWVWALLAVHATLLTIGFTLMDPSLGQERLKPGPGATDAHLRRIIALLLLAHLVVVGLDVGRFQWSGFLAVPVRVVALVLFTAGLAFGQWAMVVNRFFSSAIRLQTDRGHRVVDTGPYRLIRHPGYAGLLVAATAGGVVMGSWWSLVPLALAAVVIVRRLLMEDAFLHRELEGYATYAGRVRYKLVPGLW